MTLYFQAPKGLSGRLIPPADKSITHRALILSAIASGTSRVRNPLSTGDCISTRRCLQTLGVSFRESRGLEGEVLVEIDGVGLRGFQEPGDVLEAGNSGTTARLLAGLLAGQRFFTVLNGDGSLRKRPMGRVVEPLRSMGADIQGRNEGRNLPLVFASTSGGLKPIEYRLPIPSAQVKSALMFAALRAEGAVKRVEPSTQGITVSGCSHIWDYRCGGEEAQLILEPVARIPCFQLTVPGDISSAAFFITGALISGRELIVENCGLNPSRLGFIEVLQRMGAQLEVEEQDCTGGEPRGRLLVLPGPLRAVELGAEEIPACIDEIPLLAVLGAFAAGITRVRGAEELRHKESDRLSAVVRLISSVGGRIELTEDGFVVEGPQRLENGHIDPEGDHRIAMAAAVLSAGISGGVTVSGFEAAEVSFPDFVGMFQALGGEVS